MEAASERRVNQRGRLWDRGLRGGSRLWDPPAGEAAPVLVGSLLPLPHTAGAMTNSKETRRLPRAEATRRFDPDLGEMRVDLSGLGLMTDFPR